MVKDPLWNQTRWLAPSPLWKRDDSNGISASNRSAVQPAILRFENDLFMDELLALLAYYPRQLHEWIAKPETWMRPMSRPATAPRLRIPEPVSSLSKRLTHTFNNQSAKESSPMTAEKAAGANVDALSESLPFKLYQPAHQRYYLVAASLVCRQYGLPDHRIDPGRQESVSFILRRVIHTDSKESETPYDPDNPRWKEHAFVPSPEGFAWKEISPVERNAVAEGEERLPLFALHFDESIGYRRRLLAGLIPVARREAYLSASKKDEETPGDGSLTEEQLQAKKRSALMALFEAQVAAPWRTLVEQAKKTHETLILSPPNVREADSEKRDNAKKILKEAREQIQTVSWYVALDFAKFLETHLNRVWRLIKGESIDPRATPDEQSLVTRLMTAGISQALKQELLKGTSYLETETATSLADTLVAINTETIEDRLEIVDIPYDREAPIALDQRWPRILFPLADPGVRVQEVDPWNVIGAPDLTGPLNIYVGSTDWDGLSTELAKIDSLYQLVEQAIPALTYEPPDIQLPQFPKKPLDPRDGWFIIRCVYERPNCRPLRPAVVSRPTEKFQMAAFFDPDAPARQVRIALPADISTAGLRKYKKNATLMMSDMLCGKIKGIRKMTFGDLVLSVLPWPFHKDLPDPGETGPCNQGSEQNFGMYCSLSIPIVTLAALILMIIIVSLFDMFFRWIPYLFTCFPIPGLKGKKS